MNEIIKFCQQASRQYEGWLEEAQGDPRVVASIHPAAEWRVPYELCPGKEHSLGAKK